MTCLPPRLFAIRALDALHVASALLINTGTLLPSRVLNLYRQVGCSISIAKKNLLPSPQAYDYLSAAALVLFSLLVATARTCGLTRLREWALLGAPAAAAYG